jgi:hypothetical protein
MTSPNAEITLREVYDLVVVVKDSVAVVPAHTKTIEDHEARLRKLEDRRTVSPRDLWVGITGAIAAGAGLATLIRALIPS